MQISTELSSTLKHKFHVRWSMRYHLSFNYNFQIRSMQTVYANINWTFKYNFQIRWSSINWTFKYVLQVCRYIPCLADAFCWRLDDSLLHWHWRWGWPAIKTWKENESQAPLTPRQWPNSARPRQQLQHGGEVVLLSQLGIHGGGATYWGLTPGDP
jgi:hypothetical protein